MLKKNHKNKLWTEKYRFTKLEDIIGNDDFVHDCKYWLESKELPNLLLHSESPGTGKSSAAFMLINDFGADYLYINASKENGIDTIRNMVEDFASVAGFSTLKVVFLDEAGKLTPAAQRCLLSMIEEYSTHCRFILTANSILQIDEALASRLRKYEFTPPSMKGACEFAINLLTKETVEFTAKDVVSVVEHTYPDIRSLIDTLQRYSVSGKLVISKSLAINREINAVILAELQKPKSTSLNAIRQLIANNEVRNFVPIYKFLYRELDNFVKNNIGDVIVELNDGQLRNGQVPDTEINFITTIYNILNKLK